MPLSIKTRLYLAIGLLSLISYKSIAQGDCTVFAEDSKERIACEYGTRAIQFKQGSRTSQLLFDSAISVNPNYAWAYYEKSVAYLKRGLLSEGMSILNKAVELDPLSYLTYRAYWFFQHKSFKRCQADLERFYSMEGTYQKSTPGGALDMRIILGLTYVHLGSYQKAVELVNETIDSYPSEDYVGPYDYHTLGVLYANTGKYNEAKQALIKSIERNPQFADSYYHLAIITEELGDLKKARHYINESLLRYKGKKPGYTGYPFCFPVSQEQAEAKMKELLGS